MNIFLLVGLFFFCGLMQAGDDALIKLGQKNTCIKGVISIFVSSRNCDMLSDLQKSKIALKMTQCLLTQMKKSLPASCEVQNPSKCELHGDSWNTFSTFFTHIDNLCHFYWQALHHQKAQSLITKLSESSDSAERILRQNAQETQKILYMQGKMHSSIEQSLQNQEIISEMITNSSKNLHNLTHQMDFFLRKIHEDIDANYASLRNILGVINEGILRIISFQAYIAAQLGTIRGISYFIAVFFIILFLTSFRTYSENRIHSLFILSVNIGLELCLHSIIDSLLGINKFRYIFLIGIAVNIYTKNTKENQKKQDLSLYLNTPRLKMVFNKAINENSAFKEAKQQLGSLQYRKMERLSKTVNTC